MKVRGLRLVGVPTSVHWNVFAVVQLGLEADDWTETAGDKICGIPDATKRAPNSNMSPFFTEILALFLLEKFLVNTAAYHFMVFVLKIPKFSVRDSGQCDHWIIKLLKEYWLRGYPCPEDGSLLCFVLYPFMWRAWIAPN